MKVTMLDYTGKGSHPDHAIDLLIFTKNTRLQMSPEGLERMSFMLKEDKMKELEYMANTIPSSWEFVDYTFMIEGVTRAFQQQLTRTRTASFAIQTLRVQDVSQGPGWSYLTGPTIAKDPILEGGYSGTMQAIASEYAYQIANGAAVEDARGLLPLNIVGNVVMNINMRNFIELVQKRSSSRVQGEYHDVLEAMKEAVLSVHPWVSIFLDRTFDRAANDLDAAIQAFEPCDFLESNGMTDDNINEEKLKKWKTDLIKLVDQMRAKQ